MIAILVTKVSYYQIILFLNEVKSVTSFLQLVLGVHKPVFAP